MNRIRPEEMISVRNRRYPSGIDRIRCLKPLTFVIDVINVDGGDERLTAHPDALIQNGSSSFRWQNETRSNLPNLADRMSAHFIYKTTRKSGLRGCGFSFARHPPSFVSSSVRCSGFNGPF